jgi:hypothetical protein
MALSIGGSKTNSSGKFPSPEVHECLEGTPPADGGSTLLTPDSPQVDNVIAQRTPTRCHRRSGRVMYSYEPIDAPIVGGIITSTIRDLILVPVFSALMKERALRRGILAAERTQYLEEAMQGPHDLFDGMTP